MLLCKCSREPSHEWLHEERVLRSNVHLHSKCIELGIPVSIHCSMHYATGRSTDFSRPIYLDDVAMDFPELTLIARLGAASASPSSGFSPWCGCGSASSAWTSIASPSRPRRSSGTGWESLLHFGQNLLKERILFGSAWMTLGMSLQEVYGEFEGLPINEEVKDLWRYRNAAQLLGKGNV